MSGNPSDGLPRGVPTLTEVVDWPEGAAPAQLAAPLPSESELTAQVLAQVQQQLDLMIEYRMREALTPLLARVADNLVRDARHELASTLREVVARAVELELARQRGR
ncbi:MAG TPA: hypothetical protein VJO99_06135 [Burkholderiaceae bacterium]|nr:hypothetical protein [Burkholderiaceae bacterium]